MQQMWGIITISQETGLAAYAVELWRYPPEEKELVLIKHGFLCELWLE